MIRGTARRAWKFLRSPATLALGIFLLAMSAVGGNVFQNWDRSAQRQDLSDARDQIDTLQQQLDEVKGEQECRSRIASESELYSGRLLAALGRLVVAAEESDDDGSKQAVADIAAATAALVPALDARLDAVELCSADPDYRTGPPPFTAVTTPTTTTTVVRQGARRTSTTRSPTTTAGTTTTTVYRSSPTPSDPGCVLLPGITVPREIPCP